MRRLRCGVLSAAVTTFLLLASGVSAQEPPPPDQPAPPSPTSSSVKSHNTKYSHANDFLVVGTVFTENGYAFPGVELRIRRTNEKKFRWDSYTNSRGEFAIRVPQGTDYEMVVHVKGFAEQTKSLDAKNGLSEARMVFRMEPEKDAKK